MLTTKPHIIICTEVWRVENVAYYQLDGYKNYYNYGNLNKSDGVMIYIEESIQETTEIVHIGEIKALKTLITVGTKKTFLTSLYRSQEVSKTNFLKNFEHYLKSFKNSDIHYIIGDLNIDIQNPDIFGSEYLNNLYEKRYFPLVTAVTRPNESGGSCIDHAFVKNVNQDQVKGLVYKHMITDHYQTFLLIKLGVRKSETKTINYIDYKKLISVARNFNWTNIISDNVNESTTKLVTQVQKVIKLSTRKLNRKKKATKRKNWITKGLMTSCEHKNRLYLEWTRDKNNILKKNRYQTYNKLLQKLIRIAKIKSEQDYVKTHCTNSKTTWSYVNEKLGRSKSKKNPIDHIVIDNKTISNKKEMADKFNKYFNTVGIEMAKKINVNNSSGLNNNNNININSIFLSLTDNFEIAHIINNL